MLEASTNFCLENLQNKSAKTRRYDSLKKEWRAWDKLFSKETGISFDSANNKVVVEDEWWDRKIQENSAYAKYRYNGIRDDGYQPTMDLKEGLGDSEEKLPGATTGVSVDLEGINLSTST
ncbi:hypothetical protein K1719_015794 [Acacia pycnantha]|nr:hypothetical protein K1719_015794 [Acacia pycnantha]